MCLILFAFEHHPDFPLIVASNRDEFYQRPTELGHFWPDAPQLFAGRDREAGGTWMGVTKDGRFAAVTNFRERISSTADDSDSNSSASDPQQATLSRGELTRQFLVGNATPYDYLEQIDANHQRYAGFNLLVGSLGAGKPPTLYCYSNRQRQINRLGPGLYGLSNGLLDESWPKVDGGKRALADILSHSSDPATLLPVLLDPTAAADDQLPDTGVDKNTERLLSSRFIRSELYGTRTATIVRIDKQRRIDWLEQSFDESGGIGDKQAYQIC